MTSDIYRKLNTENDWPFFDPDCSVPESELSLIWPLSQAAACTFWNTHVSANSIERHPMSLPDSHWLAPTTQGPNWLSEESEVAPFLGSNFRLNSDERVNFVFMKERAYSVPIGLFSRHWKEFLTLDDEAPFLLHVPTGAFACFGPHGELFFGIHKTE